MSVRFAYVCERARARACVRSCARVSVCMREREAERERERQTDRRAERDRQTERETEREETGRQSRLYQVGETQSRQTCVFVCVCVQLIGQRYAVMNSNSSLISYRHLYFCNHFKVHSTQQNRSENKNHVNVYLYIYKTHYDSLQSPPTTLNTRHTTWYLKHETNKK